MQPEKNGLGLGRPEIDEVTDRVNNYLLAKGYSDQMTVTLWTTLETFKEEAPRARHYLRLTGATMVPDRVKEILHLKTSASTLGRKFRASATGDNPQLKRILIENNEGCMVVHYLWNPDYKETI